MRHRCQSSIRQRRRRPGSAGERDRQVLPVTGQPAPRPVTTVLPGAVSGEGCVAARRAARAGQLRRRAAAATEVDQSDSSAGGGSKRPCDCGPPPAPPRARCQPARRARRSGRVPAFLRLGRHQRGHGGTGIPLAAEFGGQGPPATFPILGVAAASSHEGQGRCQRWHHGTARGHGQRGVRVMSAPGQFPVTGLACFAAQDSQVIGEPLEGPGIGVQWTLRSAHRVLPAREPGRVGQ